MHSPGEKAAWESLRRADPGHPAKGALFENGSYVIRSFGADIRVDPGNETISTPSGEVDALLRKFGYFYNHVALSWLLKANGKSAAGRLIRPADLSGGQMFFRGTHVLPLERLAARYARDKEGFLQKAMALGAKPGGFGDASAAFYPVNGLPMHVILWLEDDEYPARADLLLDSAWEIALPLDIIWSAAMLVVLALSS